MFFKFTQYFYSFQVWFGDERSICWPDLQLGWPGMTGAGSPLRGQLIHTSQGNIQNHYQIFQKSEENLLDFFYGNLYTSENKF